MSIKVIEDLIPKTNPNRPGQKMTPTYITIHDTGNTDATANAMMHARYLKNLRTTSPSWHYTVDDDVVVQHLPNTENAWHAGDGFNGPGNRHSIGIEICMNQGIDRAKAEMKAQQLIAMLMLQYKIPIKNVVQHNHWSGKNCPQVIRSRANGWANFINGVQAAYEQLTNPAKVAVDGWQKKLAFEAIDSLCSQGLLKDAEQWKNKTLSGDLMNDMPWLFWIMLDRIAKKEA